VESSSNDCKSELNNSELITQKRATDFQICQMKMPFQNVIDSYIRNATRRRSQWNNSMVISERTCKAENPSRKGATLEKPALHVQV
jgi:hypothetical protein